MSSNKRVAANELTVGQTFKDALGLVQLTVGAASNLMYATERLTAVAADKAENFAEISKIADTISYMTAKAEMNEVMETNGITFDADGNMIFAGK